MRRLGYQLYSSRLYRPLSDTLSLISETGYSYVEGYPALFQTDQAVSELQRLLSKTALTMLSAHFSLSALQNEPDRIVDICRRLGIEVVVLPFLVQPLRPRTREGWLSFGHLIAEMAKPLWDAGLKFAYHNHDFEFVHMIEGGRPIDLILEANDQIYLEFDAVWAAKAGEMPEVWIRKLADRILLAHIKDMAPPDQNLNEEGWADVGYGVLDWRTLWTALNEANVEYRFVAHENPADQWRFARRSFATLRGFED